MDISALDLAAEMLRQAEDDPARLMIVASGVAGRAKASGDFALASVAARAMGVAAFHVTSLDVAARHLRAAIQLAAQARAPELAAEARLRLAFVCCVRGHIQQAMAEIDTAMSDLRGSGRARAEAQRGVIFNFLKRPEEALACYRNAVPVLRRDGDRLWLQRVLSNRGIIHGYRHEFAAAETDLAEAEAHCEQLDLDLSMAIVQQNRGWVSAMRGDVPTALLRLDLAERRFRALGTHQLCWTLVDRAELLLSAGLIAEAAEAAQEAVAEFELRRRAIGLPEARLVLARTAYLSGEYTASAEVARRAARDFARQRRPDWVAMARFVAVRASIARTGGRGVTVARIERCAAALESSGWALTGVEARMLAAGLAAERGQAGRAREQLEPAARRRHRGPALLRIRAWHAEALLRLARGDRRGARSAIRTALRVHDEHGATLRATDLRAHASGFRVEVAEAGLRMALQDGDPAQVLAWAEQGRARHLLMRPARPPDDPGLAEAMAQLRVVVAEIGEARAAGQSAGGLAKRQLALEREIRDRCRRQAGESPRVRTRPVRPGELDLDDAALVEYVHLDDLLYAVTVADGRVRLHRLGPLPPIREIIDRVPFALRRLARHRSSSAGRSAAAMLLEHAATRLDAALLRPLAAEIRDRPVVLIPSGPLQAMPWSILPSCAGRTVTLSPSATLWHASTRGQPVDGPTIAAAGPDLPGARAEVEAVASIHAVPPLVGEAASTEAVLAALDGAGLAHLAAHGRLHATNPLFSSLRLADGPLTIYDLERLRRPPQVLVLAACDSGRFVVRAGDELLGLSATFLALGTRAIVAPVLSVLDAETTTLMIALHKLLAAGHSVASALAQTQRQIAGEDAQAGALAAAFVCIGADCVITP
ncbi:CHAT domain-containing protein [Acrocarpospora pleiomorpha]|uniref:CHAT domain-containing protein n=1 Tax=Acrocarpospora pleiomorpha TaxID=90975 RepID=A0A5M3XZ87_9ACTN|nr:CHAT domain-containing protein [Acrocarpospora pleiomorpha]GES26434.1 CHAT domain-containing protein [Acrocarpospora pleiomorpha]